MLVLLLCPRCCMATRPESDPSGSPHPSDTTSLSFWVKAAFGQEPPLREINALGSAKGRQWIGIGDHYCWCWKKSQPHRILWDPSDRKMAQQTKKVTFSAAEISFHALFPVPTETSTVSRSRPFAMASLTLPKYSWGCQDSGCQGNMVSCHLWCREKDHRAFYPWRNVVFC